MKGTKAAVLLAVCWTILESAMGIGVGGGEPSRSAFGYSARGWGGEDGGERGVGMAEREPRKICVFVGLRGSCLWLLRVLSLLGVSAFVAACSWCIKGYSFWLYFRRCLRVYVLPRRHLGQHSPCCPCKVSLLAASTAAAMFDAATAAAACWRCCCLLFAAAAARCVHS